MTGCPLDQAFVTHNTETNIVKKKKKKEKKEIIYADELKPVNTFSSEENNFSNNKQIYQKLTPFDNEYQSYQPVNNVKRSVIFQPQPINNENNEVNDNTVKISNEEYRKYKEYQAKRHKNIEGFGMINDNFNDIILFGLTGVFFLIFIDYIYKLGKKSY